MNSGNDLKMYTMRNFLFYLGVTCAVCLPLNIAMEVLGWSNSVNFAVVAVTGLSISIFGMREGLFAPAKSSKIPRHHRHHA
jgi:hypothetical protein